MTNGLIQHVRVEESTSIQWVNAYSRTGIINALCKIIGKLFYFCIKYMHYVVASQNNAYRRRFLFTTGTLKY